MSWRQAARVVVSGSFKRQSEDLQKVYDELRALGCQVLSPHSIDFVSSAGGFVKTTHEHDQTVREIEDHHLRAIRQADFVWLHAPNGYVGISGAIEIGYAIASNVPIFCTHMPEELVLRHYVKVVAKPFEAIYVI